MVHKDLGTMDKVWMDNQIKAGHRFTKIDSKADLVTEPVEIAEDTDDIVVPDFPESEQSDNINTAMIAPKDLDIEEPSDLDSFSRAA